MDVVWNMINENDGTIEIDFLDEPTINGFRKFQFTIVIASRVLGA